MSRGLAINSAIKDPTGTQAVRICTAGMASGLIPSSRPWFKLKTGLRVKPDRDGKLWFQQVEDIVYRIFAGSNFYQAGYQMLEDAVVFGTAPVLIYEDPKDIVRFYNPCAGEYYLGSGSDLRTDSFYRTFVMTVLQCVQMFGLENCGPDVQTLWENKGAGLETEVIVAHAIEPNFSLEMPGMRPNLGVVPGGFTYREYYWLWGRYTPKPLSVRGFRTKPFIAPKWATTSNDPYGRSVGMDALPDILQLHTMTVRQAEAIEKLVRPPMLANLALKNQPSSILPGKVTYVEDITKGMASIFDIKLDIEHMAQLIEKIEARVQKWFFNDLFQMMANLEGVQPRNDMEIAERRGEKLQVLGPVVENITSEMAGLVSRTIQIAGRRGLLPPQPASLRGMPLEIEFDTMVQVAQRATQTASMERALTVTTNIMKAAPDKHVEDVLNWGQTLREYLDRIQFPENCKNGEEEEQGIKQARQKAMADSQKQQAQAQALTHTAPAVAGAAKDLGDVDVGGGLNAMQLLSGMGGAAPGATGLPQ